MDDLEKIYDSVMSLDDGIRPARIINNCGHSEAGVMKDDLTSLEGGEHDEMMFIKLILRVKMRREFDEEFKSVHFSLPYRKKVLLVSCEKDADIGDMPFRILGVLKQDFHSMGD